MGDEARLGVEVRLGRAVIVEVVSRQVGEDGGVEGDALHAPLIERMGRHLHGHAPHAGVHQLA